MSPNVGMANLHFLFSSSVLYGIIFWGRHLLQSDLLPAFSLHRHSAAFR
jgi:hypothetical protein